MKTKQQIIEHLNTLTSFDLMCIHNQYCQSINDCDNEIFPNDEDFFTEFFTGNPMELARSIHFGDYKYQDDYVKFNGYGNLQSIADYQISNHIDFNAIAEDIIKNENNYSLNF